MDSIIELPYIAPPESGSVTKLRPGVFVPDGRSRVRRAPKVEWWNIRRLLIPQEPVDIVGSVTNYPGGDMWLKLSENEYVAFVYGDEIYGVVRGWHLS